MINSYKIHRVLSIFLLFFLAICLRVWHLGVVLRDEKLIEAAKPQQRTILVRADRGAICDRFNIPLALNKISYNAAIYYSQIAEIPTVSWGKDGKRFPRKEYIRNLSQVLAKTLSLDAERIEDLIHAKAALFPHAPFIIKTLLSEEEHYRLKMLEKDWPGILAEIGSVRSYPFGKTACSILGTMGSISQREYSAIAQEMSELKANTDFFDLQEANRLAELKEKAYSFNDLIGKTGIESQYENELRGFFGKKTFEVDQKGRLGKILSKKDPITGKQVNLSISVELQQFAEMLLIHDERTRDGRCLGFDPIDKTLKPQKEPWIKGGAIVAMDPKTGELLALASYPRFDPNDFVFTDHSIYSLGKTRQVNRWLENENFIASLWDGIDPLVREGPNFGQEERRDLSWEFFLDLILPKDQQIRIFFEQLDVRGAIQLQEDYEAICYFEKAALPIPYKIKKRFESLPLKEADKVFAADLCRTVIYAPAFTDSLIERIGKVKIAKYRQWEQEFMRKEYDMRQKAKERFRQTVFKEFREKNQKEFLKAKRDEEKERKTYARPYIDYLDKKEDELFKAYWAEEKFSLLATDEMPEDLIRTFRPFSELTRPLFGKYRKLRNYRAGQTEKDLAAAFYPVGGFGFSRSYACEAGVPPGSVFKLVTAYEALRQGKNLTIIDERSRKGVAYTPKRNLYPRYYKGGRLPRSAKACMGPVDLMGAIEQSSNPYFAILAGDYFADPEDLSKAARLFGYGEKTGVDLPRETRGKLPNDLKTNRTGLYSASIGQHTLLTTPLQTAGMLSAIANGGKVLKPKVVNAIIGTCPDRHPLKAFNGSTYFAKEALDGIGIFFPLFTSMQPPLSQSGTLYPPSEVKREIPMDSKIRAKLLEGMDRVVSSPRGSARSSSIKALIRNPPLMRDYLALEHQMVGKTGTAEILANFSINPTNPAGMYKHIWFGSLAFTDTTFTDPELVVVVFLRYGDAGKEAAPLAAQMIHKWREIKKKHKNKTPYSAE